MIFILYVNICYVFRWREWCNRKEKVSSGCTLRKKKKINDYWCFQRAARKAFHSSAARFLSSDFIGWNEPTAPLGVIWPHLLTSNMCIYNINHAHEEKTQDCKQKMDVDAILSKSEYDVLSWALSPPSCCVKSRFNESGVKQRHRKLFYALLIFSFPVTSL